MRHKIAVIDLHRNQKHEKRFILMFFCVHVSTVWSMGIPPSARSFSLPCCSEEADPLYVGRSWLTNKQLKPLNI